MADERITSRPAAAGPLAVEHEKTGAGHGAHQKERSWAPVAVLAAILFLVLLVRSLGSQGTPPKAPDQHLKATAHVDNYTGQLRRPLSLSASPGTQGTKSGLSYETPIPRPTVKGYYEPKIVPYPVGKPVYVNGYYRKNGTYVQPHFRALPRR